MHPCCSTFQLTHWKPHYKYCYSWISLYWLKVILATNWIPLHVTIRRYMIWHWVAYPVATHIVTHPTKFDTKYRVIRCLTIFRYKLNNLNLSSKSATACTWQIVQYCKIECGTAKWSTTAFHLTDTLVKLSCCGVIRPFRIQNLQSLKKTQMPLHDNFSWCPKPPFPEGYHRLCNHFLTLIFY